MANNPNVSIEITANANQAEAELDRAGQAVTKLGQKTDAANLSIDKMGGLAANSAKVALGLNEVAELMGRVTGTVGDLAHMADQFAGLTGRLKLAVGEGAAFAQAFEEVRSIANATGGEIESTATLFGRLTMATKELGLSQGQVAQLTADAAYGSFRRGFFLPFCAILLRKMKLRSCVIYRANRCQLARAYIQSSYMATKM